jgi:hypothetical protein
MLTDWDGKHSHKRFCIKRYYSQRFGLPHSMHRHFLALNKKEQEASCGQQRHDGLTGSILRYRVGLTPKAKTTFIWGHILNVTTTTIMGWRE